MSLSDQLLEQKTRIKQWEKLFFSDHGRIPGKADVKANKDIRKAYKTYNYLKEKAKQQNLTKPLEKESKLDENANQEICKPHFPSETSLHKVLDVSIDLSEDEEEDMEEALANAELGPTPQANGKVMSIFDMIMSPPDSSPLKQKNLPLSHFSSPTKVTIAQQEFKTPTRAALRILFADLTPSRGSQGKPSIMAKLREASSPQKQGVIEPVSTPTKRAETVVETPFYLGKINNKFLFLDRPSGIPASEITTPSKAPATAFPTSPSPLKLQRMVSFGSTRSVSDIFNDNRSINIEEFADQKIELEKELQLMEEEHSDNELEPLPQSRKRKVLTQKRTTRRWKIKPNSQLDKEDAFEGKDIHDELRKLDETERKNYALYMEGGKKVVEEEEIEEEEEDDEEELPMAKKVPTSTGKLKPISNNFQRLKINDPRSKRFKQRMRWR